MKVDSIGAEKTTKDSIERRCQVISKRRFRVVIELMESKVQERGEIFPAQSARLVLAIPL